MKQSSAFSQTSTRMSPGTFYGTVKRLVDDGLVEEVYRSTERRVRIYYSLTEIGREKLIKELSMQENIVRLAKDQGLLPKFRIGD